MKTIIFSLLAFALISSVAQPASVANSSRILIDGGNEASVLEAQNARLQIIKETVKSLDMLYKQNAGLHAILDILVRENQKLETQNYALKLRNVQLKNVDEVAISQNLKLIHHNEKRISKNEISMLENASLIQVNQEAIRINEERVALQIKQFESLQMASN